MRKLYRRCEYLRLYFFGVLNIIRQRFNTAKIRLVKNLKVRIYIETVKYNIYCKVILFILFIDSKYSIYSAISQAKIIAIKFKQKTMARSRRNTN